MIRPTLSAWLVFTACTALAQNPRLVTLNLTATDAQGHGVSDLAADEIRIADQGKPQTVASFRKEVARAAAPLVPGGFTNRPAALTGVHVILLDLMNMDMANRQATIDQIVRTIEHLETADSVYLYLETTGGELVPVHGLPAASPIAAAEPWVKDARPLLEKAMGPVAQTATIYQRDLTLRIKTIYAALETLAARLAPISGRKTITWVTNGVPRTFPVEGGDIFDSIANLRQSAGRIAQGNVAINPVSKLLAPAPPENLATMQEFADLTGGKLYQGGDVEAAVPDAIQAARTTYRVQFAPAAKDWDGKFHKVRVTSTRKGVNIQSEQGYNADKQAPARRDPSQELFQSPFDSSDIGLRATVAPGAEPQTYRLQIAIDPQDLHLVPQGDRFGIQISFTFAGYLADGHLQGYPPTPINVAVTAEQREKAARDGFKFGQNLTVGETATKVRLLVEDHNGHSFGTLTIPVRP